MKRIIVTSSILALTGTAALAGGYTAPQTEAVVTPAPVVVAPANYNWSGFYGGAQLGYGKAQDAIEADGVVGGIHGGYLKDFGNFVLGGEVAYNAANLKETINDGETTTTAKVKSMTDLKAIGGVPYQNMLFYGTLGASYVDAEVGGTSYSDTVPLVGLGMKYAINDKWSVGGELDHRIGNNFDGTTNDLNTTTLALTASYKF